MPIKELRQKYALTQLHGSADAMNRLRDAVFTLAQKGTGSFIVLTGVAGVGKSRLLNEVRSFVASIRSLKQAVETFEDHGDVSKKHVPFSGMMRIIASLLWRGVGSSKSIRIVEPSRKRTCIPPRRVHLSSRARRGLPALVVLFSDVATNQQSLGINLLKGDCDLGEAGAKTWVWKIDNTLYIKVVGPTSDGEAVCMDTDNVGTPAAMNEQVNISEDISAIILDLLQSPDEGYGRPVLLIDDAQWLDWDSWQVLIRIAKAKIMNAAVVLASRPVVASKGTRSSGLSSISTIDKSGSSSFLRLVAKACMNNLRRTIHDDGAFLTISEMEEEDCNKYCCELLGTDRIPNTIGSFIYQKSHGNPLFVREVVVALKRETGLPEVPRFQIAPSDSSMHAAKALQESRAKLYTFLENVDLSKVPIPDSLQGIIRGRIDKLSSGQQSVLKVASVLGPSNIDLQALIFLCEGGSDTSTPLSEAIQSISSGDSESPPGLLERWQSSRDLPPFRSMSPTDRVEAIRNDASFASVESSSSCQSLGLSRARRELGPSLEALVEQDLLVLDERATSACGASYRFCDFQVREVATKLMPFFQRKTLHTRAALYYELRLDKARGAVGKFQTQEWYKARRKFFKTETVNLQVLVARHWQLAERFQRAASFLSAAVTIAKRLGHCSKTAELVETAILYYDQWRRGALKSADAKSVRVCCNGRKCGKKDRDKRRISSFNSFSSVEQSRGSSPSLSVRWPNDVESDRGRRVSDSAKSMVKRVSSFVVNTANRMRSASAKGSIGELPFAEIASNAPGGSSLASFSDSVTYLSDLTISQCSSDQEDEDISIPPISRVGLLSCFRHLGDAYRGLGKRLRARDSYYQAIRVMMVPHTEIIESGLSCTRPRIDFYPDIPKETTLEAICLHYDYCPYCHDDVDQLITEILRCHIALASVYEMDHAATCERAAKRLHWVIKIAAQQSKFDAILAEASAAHAYCCSIAAATGKVSDDAKRRAGRVYNPRSVAAVRFYNARRSHFVSNADWNAKEEIAESSASFFKTLGCNRQVERATETRGRMAYFRGDVRRACKLFESYASSSNARQDAEMEIRAHLGMSMCFRRLGDKMAWFASLRRAEDIVAREFNTLTPGTVAMCASSVLLQRTLCQMATPRYVTFVLNLLKDVPPLHMDFALALCDCIEAHLIAVYSTRILQSTETVDSAESALLRRHFILGVGACTSPSEALAQSLGDNAKVHLSKLLHKLRVMSKACPLMRASYKRFLGLFLWSNKKQSAALLKWKQSSAAADKHGMRADAALANYELGRHLHAVPRISSRFLIRGSAKNSLGEREKRLKDAIAAFNDLGLAWHAACAAAERSVKSLAEAPDFFAILITVYSMPLISTHN